MQGAPSRRLGALLPTFVYNSVTMRYIVGLGNPGEKYEGTRHNIGRDCLLTLANEGGFSSWEHSKHANAFFSRGEVGGEAVELVLPETFMNKSGEALQYVVKKHEAKPEDFIVVHDDIDLALGELKLSQGRGAGGNNGVESIIKSLKSKDFARVRVGIAPTSFWTGKVKRPATGGPLERYVLKPFSRSEKVKLADIKQRVSEVLEAIVTDGIEKAMNTYN